MKKAPVRASGCGKLLPVFLLYSFYASINVKPEWRGGPWAYVGHLTSIAFPTLGNLTKDLGSRLGTFAFFARRDMTKSYRPISSSVRNTAIKAMKDGYL